jgi:heterodisulfide reductase subunit C
LTVATVLNLTSVERDTALMDHLAPARWLLLRCIHCGTCTASCPSAAAMDLTPRHMWRMVQLGLTEQVLRSKTIWLCSLCYQCHVRCPRGIPLTETIVTLKEIALERGIAQSRESAAFYRAFADVMRRYGRMREVEFMARYFLATNPLSALGYAKMGLTMLMRGKLKIELPRLTGEGRLDRLFARVAELEAQR